MLDSDEAAQNGIEGRSLQVAVALRPDFGCHGLAVGRGIILGDGAVGVDADDRASMVLHVLGAIALAAVAGRDEQCVVVIDDDARAEMVTWCRSCGSSRI
jgi:hypothetical protein